MGRGLARWGPFILSLQGLVWPEYHFWPDLNTERGVVIYMYLKHFPDEFDFQIYRVHRSNSLGPSVIYEVPFLACLALHNERRRCGTQPMLLPKAICVCIPSCRPVALRVCLAEAPRLPPFITIMVTIFWIFVPYFKLGQNL